MSIHPLLTFKAGRCDVENDVSPFKVRPNPQQGYVYLYYDAEELIHFCWRARDASLDDPSNIDLLMVPTDGTFVPFTDKNSTTLKSPVAGRVFVLKFSSSSARHFFWLQSAPQPADQPSHFSSRDIKIGELANSLLQGLDPDSAQAEVENIRDGRDDGDEEMEDVRRSGADERRGSGGAGRDATGGDVIDEGEGSREGGADGARAPPRNDTLNEDASRTIQNFLQSLGPSSQNANRSQALSDPYTTIPDLLTSSVTTSALTSQNVTDKAVSEILKKHVPSSLIYLAHGMDPSDIPDADDPEAIDELVDALGYKKQRDVLRRIYQSPQFSQACMSLTSAIRDGGLPGIADALNVEVAQGGYFNRSSGIPMSGGAAVEAFVNGVRKNVESKSKK